MKHLLFDFNNLIGFIESGKIYHWIFDDDMILLEKHNKNFEKYKIGEKYNPSDIFMIKEEGWQFILINDNLYNEIIKPRKRSLDKELDEIYNFLNIIRIGELLKNIYDLEYDNRYQYALREINKYKKRTRLYKRIIKVLDKI